MGDRPEREAQKTRALLLSGALWPGAGQVYLGERVTGGVFAAVAGACLVVLLKDVTGTVIAALPADGSPLPLDQILDFVGRIRKGLPARVGWLQLTLVADWLLCLADLLRRPAG